MRGTLKHIIKTLLLVAACIAAPMSPSLSEAAVPDITYKSNTSSPYSSAQLEYTKAGTYTWTVPAGINQIKVTTVGAGGGAGVIMFPTTNFPQYRSVSDGGGGGGGAIVENQVISVTSGTQLQIVVGAKGDSTIINTSSQVAAGSAYGKDGGNSYIKIGSQIYAVAHGGTGSNNIIYNGGSGTSAVGEAGGAGGGKGGYNDSPAGIYDGQDGKYGKGGKTQLYMSFNSLPVFTYNDIQFMWFAATGGGGSWGNGGYLAYDDYPIITPTTPVPATIGGGAGSFYAPAADGAVFINYGSTTVATTGITLSQTALTLNAGGSSTLTATVTPSNATNKTVTWATSNASVATVSGGKVTAVGPGTATITATTSGGQKATCTVTVRVPVTGISISRSTLALTVGATSTLTATVAPSNASDKSYSWSSSNSAVATVNSSGLVTAKANGTATITATTTDGGKKATCAVTVTTPASGVSVAPTTATIIKGQTQQLTATVAPSSASNKSVSWSSSNNSVATVNSSGLVTAKAAGNADITVTTADGNYKAVCKVTVRVPVTGVSLSQTELSLIKGSTEQLLATVFPADASNKTISWTTTDKSVASVSSTGLVTAVGGGTATITATTADGSYTDVCKVTVTVPVEGIKFGDVSSNVGIGSTTKLNYTITPPEATNKTVTWQSSDPAVATVDETIGVITPVAPGGTEITVTTEDGGYTDTTLLIVTNSLSTIKLKLITESGKYPTFGTVYYKSPGNVIEYPGTPVGDDGNMTISVPVTLTSFNLGVSLLNTLISGTVLNPETKDATATPLYMVEGDFNADNLISGTDWTILVQRLNYGGGETKYGLTGDMNYDGVVDNLDLLLFNSPITHTGVTRFMTSGYDMSVDTKAVTESENAPALNAVSFAAAAEDTPDIKENLDESPVSDEPPIKSIVQITKIKDGRYEISLNEPSRNINMFQLALEGGVTEITYALPSGFELIGAGEKDGVTVIAIGTTVKGGLTIPADTPFITVTAASQPGVLYGDNFTTAERASAHGIEIVSLESSETVGEAGASASGGSSGCNAGTAAAALLAFAPFIIHKSHKSYRNRRNHK